MERQEQTAAQPENRAAEQSWQQSLLVECWPGGPIVRTPRECPERDGWRNRPSDSDLGLPNLELPDDRQQA